MEFVWIIVIFYKSPSVYNLARAYVSRDIYFHIHGIAV